MQMNNKSGLNLSNRKADDNFLEKACRTESCIFNDKQSFAATQQARSPDRAKGNLGANQARTGNSGAYRRPDVNGHKSC